MLRRNANSSDFIHVSIPATYNEFSFFLYSTFFLFPRRLSLLIIVTFPFYIPSVMWVIVILEIAMSFNAVFTIQTEKGFGRIVREMEFNGNNNNWGSLYVIYFPKQNISLYPTPWWNFSVSPFQFNYINSKTICERFWWTQAS